MQKSRIPSVSSAKMVIVLLLLGWTALVFSPVLSNDFVNWDDDVLIYQNPHYQPPTLETVANFWASPYEYLYSPVTYSVWGGLAWLARVAPPSSSTDSPLPSDLTPHYDPHIFHSFSLLVHAATVLLVFGLLAVLVRNDLAAGLGAAFVCPSSVAG